MARKAIMHGSTKSVLFHTGRHPCDGGKNELASFLEHLTVDRKISGASQGPALNALVIFSHAVWSVH
ncbi:MAG: phage integrase N-terminal SAM-like domain-containing protein [Candidatus Thiodiazotropha sp.]